MYCVSQIWQWYFLYLRDKAVVCIVFQRFDICVYCVSEKCHLYVIQFRDLKFVCVVLLLFNVFNRLNSCTYYTSEIWQLYVLCFIEMCFIDFTLACTVTYAVFQRFDQGIFGLGEEYNDKCEGDTGNCMSQLSFQVLVLILAKPIPRFLLDIVLP